MSTFGVPITDRTLRAMPKYYNKTITQSDRAREAMRTFYSDKSNSNLDALQHVLELKQFAGNGISTLCLVYNATGDTLELVVEQNWFGEVYRDRPARRFENGQWIAFLHVKPSAVAQGSEAARVFRGKTVTGEVRDYMVAWRVPWATAAVQNSAYTEVRGRNHFPQYWNYINGLLRNAEKVTFDESDKHCTSAVAIGGVTSPEFIAVLKHTFTPEP